MGNNPVKYVDPTGNHIDDWRDNGDGTWTVIKAGAMLWDVWGSDWKEKSGFTRDPKTLQIGETVGSKNVVISDVKKNQCTIFIGNSNYVFVEPIQFRNSNVWMEEMGDILSWISIGLNVASTLSLLTGNILFAEIFNVIAAGCDLGATGLYFVSGNNTKAAMALTATMIDFVPGPYKFNKSAGRYISVSTGRFVSKSLGQQVFIIPKTMGLGLNFLNIDN